jgi:hypothetical protein
MISAKMRYRLVSPLKPAEHSGLVKQYADDLWVYGVLESLCDSSNAAIASLPKRAVMSCWLRSAPHPAIVTERCGLVLSATAASPRGLVLVASWKRSTSASSGAIASSHRSEPG